jgi:DNA repair protein RadC
LQNDAEGHRGRIRERYLKEGLDSFQDYEVLELQLSTHLPRIDTKPIAKELLRRFGSLYRVYEASPEDLMKVKGIGVNTAFALSMQPHLYRRYQMDRWRTKRQLKTRREVGAFCASLFIGEKYEISKLVLLNTQAALLHVETISRGTIDQVSIYSRNVTEIALRHQAKYAVITHNHPGGSSQPSDGDIEVTNIIGLALKVIGVGLLDHFIVMGDDFVSVAEYTRQVMFDNEAMPDTPPPVRRKRKSTPPTVDDDECAAEKQK